MPIYCRKCRQQVPDLPSTATSAQCPHCGAPINMKDGVARRPARLLLKDADETVGEFKITTVLTIGKDKANDVQILHPSVSLKHAHIKAHGGGFIVRDLQTPTGTFVNGQKITAAPLRDGDELKTGEVRFVFLHPAESLLPGQDFAIAYTQAAQDLDSVAACLPPEELAGSRPQAVDGQTVQDTAVELTRLAKVCEIGRELASSVDLALVLEKVMDALFENMNPSRAAILMKHATTGELYSTVVRTRKGGKERAKIPISRTVVNTSMTKREAILIADVGSLKAGQENTMVRHGIRSALCVPLLVKGQLLGCLYTDCLDAVKVFRETDLRFVMGIAGMASVAIVNARLMARLTQERELRLKLERRMGGEWWCTGLSGLEEKDVTVLALRLLGAGSILESSPSDKMALLVQELLGIIHDRIQAVDGSIVGVSGSTVVVVWGISHPRETDPTTGVRTAVDLRNMFMQLNASRSNRGLRPIWMSYGMAMGRVLVGPAAFRGRSEPALVGTAAEVATRLAARATQGQILVASSTLRRIHGKIESVEAEPLVFDNEPQISVHRIEALALGRR